MDWQDRIVTVCFLMPFLHCGSVEPPLVALYGGSSIGRCIENDPNLTSQGNYSTLQEALEQLRETEFSHYTVCLRSSANYSVSSAIPNITRSNVGIMSHPTNGSTVTVFCNATAFQSGASHTLNFNDSDEVRLENVRFEGCPAPIRLELVQNVVISQSSFRSFTEAVFDIFNCPHVRITDSHFQHNLGTSISNASSRGNTGGLAIGFKDPPTTHNFSAVTIEILNTTFVNNSANTSSLGVAINSTVYPGRGGALGIFISHSFDNVTVVIADCLFVRNFAGAYGGAVFYLIAQDSVEDNVYFRNTVFDSNMGNLGASGMMLVYIARDTERPAEMPALFNITDCVFKNHTSRSGGALAVFPSYFGGGGSRVVITNSTFTQNHENESDPFSYGSAIAISEINLFSDRSALPKHEIIDCTFVNNSGENGIFNNGYAPVRFSGTNRFIGNRGTPLKVVGALVELANRMEFINNTVPNGAALYFTSLSQARISPGLSILFDGNVGRLGASLFVDNPISITNLLYNPLCFLLHEDITLPPDQWHNITIISTRNSAIEGSTLYIRQLDACGWISFHPPFFNLTSIRDWPIWDIRHNNNTGFEGDMKTDAAMLTVNTSKVLARPNQLFPVTVRVTDQFDLLTSVTAQYSYTSHDITSNERVLVQPELEAITSVDTFTQNFTCVTDSPSAEGRVLISNGLKSKAFQTEDVSLNSFEIQLQPCTGGYALEETEAGPGLLGCVCDIFDIEEILLCRDDQDTIVIRPENWVSYVPYATPNLEFYPCPAGYCTCVHDDPIDAMCMYLYRNSAPNQQCACHRQGILCGECTATSVTILFNHCSNCTDTSALLLPALIISDVAVFIVLTLVNTPLPEWTYPFLFYIQMAPYVAEYFPKSFDKIGKYLYFIGSASSFYFVYDFCLYEGMSALGGAALRYIPLLLAVLTVPAVMCFRRYMARRRRATKYHGLWWITLLLFSHVVYASMSILNCPSITDSNGDTKSRWFINGEVECFAGTHLPLGLGATAVLLLTTLLIAASAGITFSWGYYGKPQWINSLRAALSFSYREQYEWWISVELARRTLLLLVLLAFPRNTTAIVLVLSIILAMYGHVQPYKHRITNLIEVAILTNFIVLLLLRETRLLIEEYVVFPRTPDSHDDSICGDTPTGVATITWILSPLYYAPVIVFTLAMAVYTAVAIRNCAKKIRTRRQNGYRLPSPLGDESMRHFTLSPLTTHTSLRVHRGAGHGVASIINHKESPSDKYSDLSDPFLK